MGRKAIFKYIIAWEMKREWRPFCAGVVGFFLCARMVCGWVHKAPVKNQMRMKKTNQQANKWNKEKRTPLNVSKQGIQYNHTCHFFKFN